MGIKTIQIFTQQDFLKAAIEIHGDKYGYDDVKFEDLYKKVNIFCKKCKIYFSQTPWSHIRQKCGCPYCGKSVKLTQEEFVRRCKALHGDVFGYDNAVYNGTDAKTSITCNICGKDFLQRPSYHLQFKKYGCPKCVGKAKLTREELLERLIKVHGDKFDYSRVREIKTMREKIEVLCKECQNWFFPVAGNHLYNKSGCSFCTKNAKVSLEELLKRFVEIHGNRYDYSLILDLENLSTKKNIICKKCNKIFEQKPKVHLKGHGCTYCYLKNESLVLDTFSKIFSPFEFKKSHPDFLKVGKLLKNGTRAPLELDGYNEKLKLAVEYDGSQHYDCNVFIRMSHYNRGVDDFNKLKERDLLKEQKCKENNITFIRIKGLDNIEKQSEKINEVNKQILSNKELNDRFVITVNEDGSLRAVER